MGFRGSEDNGRSWGWIRTDVNTLIMYETIQKLKK